MGENKNIEWLKIVTQNSSIPEKQKIKVLIVDDSPLLCHRTADALSADNSIEVLCCTDSEQAVSMAEGFSPSVIIQDVSMPGIDGLDILKLYRKIPSLMGVPVIIHSSEEKPEVKTRAFTIGANDYLVKSDDDVELVTRVKYHANRFFDRREMAVSVPISSPTQHPIKVFMIDSSNMACHMVKDLLLADESIQFQYCTNQAGAVDAASDFLPTVIIQNITVDTKVSEFQLLERLKNSLATKDVPILIRSSFDDFKLKAECFGKGANDYLVKPDNDDELVSRVRLHSNEYINTQEGKLFQSVSMGVSEPVKVFMVDDSELICVKYGETLRSEKEVIFTYCTDSEEALETASRFKPTVIILDLIMPKKDGLLLIEEFREHPATHDTPIIILSESDSPVMKAKTFALGANDFIPKGTDKIELLSRVNYHTKAYRNSVMLKRSIQTLLETQKRLEAHGAFIRKIFGRYVSDEVVANLLEAPEGLKLGGEKREVTILMADIRNFTPLGEELPPEQVLKILNNFFFVMTDILIRYGATIDEFIGDAILAIFGAPVYYENHAARAVACAIEMQLGMEKVNDLNRNDELPEINMGIGVNTGEVVIGNVGSEKRMKFGVIGRHVNLTARIEAYTEGKQIFISEFTKMAVQGTVLIKNEMEKEPKGIKGKVKVFDIYGIDGEYNVRMDYPDDNG